MLFPVLGEINAKLKQLKLGELRNTHQLATIIPFIALFLASHVFQRRLAAVLFPVSKQASQSQAGSTLPTSLRVY